jgi:hypothetical protein
MKYLRLLLVAIVTLLTFGAAQAQIVVKARIAPRHHYYHHHYRHHHYYHHHR